MEYFVAFGVALVLNLLLFVPAYVFKTDKLTDLSYSLSFLIVGYILFFFSNQSIGHVLAFTMIALWSLRLGGYLFLRIRRINRDTRFDGIRESFSRFLKFWVLQGISVFIILLPSIALMSTKAEYLHPVSLFGLLVWVLGLGIESVADYQKYRFIQNESASGTWIQSGLWRYSRHPNYFGEILVWVGIYIFATPFLSFPDWLIAVVGPSFIAYLIIFVTGIPLLEKSADVRWGSDPRYQKYKRSTNVLVPFFPRK